MIPLLLCLHRSHDTRLVGLAVLVCVLGVYATYAIGNHAARSKARERRIWATVSVVTTGCTAWATHFILLLAFQPGVPAGFDPVMTLVSLLIAVSVIGVGVIIVVHERARSWRFLGGVTMGAGIASLHYVGQAAYVMQATTKWNVPLVVWSLLISMLLTGPSGILSGSRKRSHKLASAPLLLAAIAILHFSGMAAATLFFDPYRNLPAGLIKPSLLGPVVASAAVFALILASIGLRFELIAKTRQRKTRDRLRELANVALEGLLVCDCGVVMTVNKSFERLCGSEGAALKGRDTNSLLIDLNLSSMAEDEEYDAQLRVADGHLVPVRVLRRTVTAGARAQTVLAVRDQRERLRREEEREALLTDLRSALDKAEAANVAKSQFLANMSHEIRTPLNGVLGMAQALALDRLDSRQQEKVRTIQDAGRSLLVLLDDILDLSKIEAGHLKLEVAPFDFERMTRTACALFAETAKTKGLPVVFTTVGEVRGLWKGDENRCRQIVSILLANAIKFTVAGEVQVVLERAASGAIRLRVSDTGVGIDKADVPKLFSKFYQTDAKTTRRMGGAGLGLAICRELSQAMGGSISVDTDLGQGSTFKVELPLKFLMTGAAVMVTEASAHDAQMAVSGREVQPEAGMHVSDAAEAHAALRILAAEDNPTNQLVLRTLLQAFEATVLVVENGCAAVEAWKNGTFDLILMDIQMPEMDGVTATQRIRSLENHLGRARTPIIALTANVMKHQIQEYQLAGMDGHVAKPIQIERLGEALYEACEGAQIEIGKELAA